MLQSISEGVVRIMKARAVHCLGEQAKYFERRRARDSVLTRRSDACSPVVSLAVDGDQLALVPLQLIASRTRCKAALEARLASVSISNHGAASGTGGKWTADWCRGC